MSNMIDENWDEHLTEHITKITTKVVKDMLVTAELMSHENTLSLVQDETVDHLCEDDVSDFVTRSDVEDIAGDYAIAECENLDIIDEYAVKELIEQHAGENNEEIDITQAVQEAFDEDPTLLSMQKDITDLHGLVGVLEVSNRELTCEIDDNRKEWEKQYVNSLGRINGHYDQLQALKDQQLNQRISILEAGDPGQDEVDGLCPKCEDVDLIASFIKTENDWLREENVKLRKELGR